MIELKKRFPHLPTALAAVFQPAHRRSEPKPFLTWRSLLSFYRGRLVPIAAGPFSLTPTALAAVLPLRSGATKHFIIDVGGSTLIAMNILTTSAEKGLAFVSRHRNSNRASLEY